MYARIHALLQLNGWLAVLAGHPLRLRLLRLASEWTMCCLAGGMPKMGSEGHGWCSWLSLYATVRASVLSVGQHGRSPTADVMRIMRTELWVVLWVEY
jgi:hypothetical protein